MSASAYVFLEKGVVAQVPALEHLEQARIVDVTIVLHTLLVAAVLLSMGAVVRGAFRGDRVRPLDKPLALPNLLEMGVGGFLSFMEGIMGAHARRFLPLVGTAFFFILLSNLMGSLPGFDSPTANLNTTLACALVVFFATHFVGFRTHGVSYLKQFVGPVPALAPLMIPLEIIGHLARVVSLSMRLFGNIFGDHMVVATFLGMVPLLVPVIFMGLGVFVAFVQAFVFALLSIIYINMAMEEHH